MDFKLPEIGEGVHEGEIVKWLVKPGDSVKEDQALVEIMTDKATVEVPTSVGGVVEALKAKEGDVVKVGQVIATLKEGAAAAKAPSVSATQAAAPTASRPAPTATAAAPAPVATYAAAAPSYGSASAPTHASAPMHAAPASYVAEAGEVLASPATRRLARELGLDLRGITASGPKGRVLKDDVQRFAAASVAGSPTFVQPMAGMSAPAAGTAVTMRAPATRPQNPFTQTAARETAIPLRGVRKKIAEGMRHSKDTAAHFSYVDECDVSELVKFRAEMKKVAEEKGIKLTYLPFLVKAVVQALRKFPMLNSSLVEEGPQAGNIIMKNYYNIGIAVDTADGLMVPVIKDADRKTILEIAWEIQDLAARALTKKLTSEDMKGGTFTITNAGTIGGLFATPIINHPEVAILGFNKIAKRPHIKGDQIVAADMTWFSISVDHRVVDGADAARFMNEFMGAVANPKKLMLEMI